MIAKHLFACEIFLMDWAVTGANNEEYKQKTSER